MKYDKKKKEYSHETYELLETEYVNFKRFIFQIRMENVLYKIITASTMAEFPGQQTKQQQNYIYEY